MDRVALALQDRSAPLHLAAREAEVGIHEAFITETAPDGTPWEPWADSYKSRAALNIGLLRQSDELYEVATSTRTTRVSHDTVFYDTSFLPHYGLAHESGLPNRKTRLPQRSFLGLSDESQLLIYGQFVAWFEGALSFYPTASGKIGRRHSHRDESGLFASFDGGDEGLEE
jgi:hypothetical protein